jgi:hypothetical protein
VGVLFLTSGPVIAPMVRFNGHYKMSYQAENCGFSYDHFSYVLDAFHVVKGVIWCAY